MFYVTTIVSLNSNFYFYFTAKARRANSTQSETADKQMRQLQTQHKLVELYYISYCNEGYTVFFLSSTRNL